MSDTNDTDFITKQASDLLDTGNHAIILYGPPGTGKTFTAKQIARKLLEMDPNTHFENHAGSAVGEVRIVQFHPNYTYQDFIGGIFPKIKNEKIIYEQERGVFTHICKSAKDLSQRKYIIIIDEINRADLSSVFGELLYCLEYRGESLDIPLFGQFSIPPNVYIIGTMNNTDKSLIGFDLALRRRFAFIKVMPDMKVLENVLNFKANKEEFIRRAVALNKSLKDVLGLPDDKLIGHAYFLKITDFASSLSAQAMEMLWTYHLEPLLEEYLGMEFENLRAEIDNLKDAFCADFK
ncbi:MAG: AAA family ATPase [Alphaproteobacteria bacterium]|nr:AAA family ATPase [Alphaproteobacteria bacterium]MCL2505750.1 AAA family ATPase [Alphaproteobacteria bacterium]